MRVLSRFVVVMVLVTAVLVALSAGPVPAGAQCSMMGGGSGGHDHAARGTKMSRRSQASQRSRAEGLAVEMQATGPS